MRKPHVKIVSRIYTPESGAAAFRLESLAHSFAQTGASVEVVTTLPPRGLDTTPDADIKVSRWPVLRNRQGYVRGYLEYLSFDIPVLFRIIFGRRADLIVCEPPPTTVFSTIVAGWLRRIPVVSYAPDIWSDASAGVGTPSSVVAILRGLERFGWRRSLGVVTVNEGVADRVAEIAPEANIAVVGNGVNIQEFTPDGPCIDTGLFMVYTGTVSEWQGAEIFVRAASELREDIPNLRLVFIGQGKAWGDLQALATELDAPVDFVSTVPPAQAAAWLRSSVASLASIKPGQQYDFAFPTKTFASWACGTPVIYAGPGPARDVLSSNKVLGIGVDYDLEAVKLSMASLARGDFNADDSEEIAAWAHQNVSLDRVSAKVIARVREWLQPEDRL